MSPISDNERARMAANNGEDGRRFESRKLKLAIKHELDAIEQLAERIAIQCAAERRLGEIIPGRPYDRDRLRVIRLALNSAAEALVSAKRTSYQVDIDELGLPEPEKVRINFTEVCEETMDGIDGFASDLGFVANSESYMLGLITSRRRPDPAALEFMGHSIQAINVALSNMGAPR
jgi:hypothetical protein